MESSISSRYKVQFLRLYMLLVAAGIFTALYLTSDSWKGLELRSRDLRWKVCSIAGLPGTAGSGKTVVVGMEEDELLRDKPKIFWYPEIGSFVLKMKEYGAAAVGIDLIPVHSLGSEIVRVARGISGPLQDREQERFLEELGENTDQSLLGPLLQSSGSVRIVQGMAEGLVPYFYPLLPMMPGVTAASVRVTPDDDHVVRRQGLQMEGRSSFSHGLYLSSGGTQRPRGDLLLNYSLSSSIPRYSFTDVLRGKVDPERFRGKTVILGFINKYEDVFPTPAGILPGAQIHAVTLETLLTGSGLKETTPATGALLLLAMTVLAACLSAFLRPLHALGAVVLLTVAYGLAATLLFAGGRIIPLFPQELGPLVAFSLIFPYRYLLEEGKRKKIYQMFSYYMDNRVIDSLLDKDIETLLKGEYKEVTVLFLDIRSFTRLCDRQNADEIVRFLNTFLGRMTEIIEFQQGMVNKYVGDGLLACFFGDGDGVLQGVEASRRILAAVDVMNADGTVTPDMEWSLRVGIGIDYGSVLMGNIGSEKRMDFTVIGSAVNLASRLEGLNKRFGTSLLLSANAAEILHARGVATVSMGANQIRGLDRTMEVFTLPDLPLSAPAEPFPKEGHTR